MHIAIGLGFGTAAIIIFVTFWVGYSMGQNAERRRIERAQARREARQHKIEAVKRTLLPWRRKPEEY